VKRGAGLTSWQRRFLRRRRHISCKAFDAASGVEQLLLAGEERVAIGANFDAQHIALIVERVGKVFPHAQCTVTA